VNFPQQIRLCNTIEAPQKHTFLASTWDCQLHKFRANKKNRQIYWNTKNHWPAESAHYLSATAYQWKRSYVAIPVHVKHRWKGEAIMHLLRLSQILV